MKKEDRRAAAKLRACPTCDAFPGQPCTGKSGPRISVHQARLTGVTAAVAREMNRAQERVLAGKADGFYQSPEWRGVRYKALRASGGCCSCCGARASIGKPLHVDHIKPRSEYRDLALELSNLQVLCDDCNMGKGTSDKTDWRPGAMR